jgi:prepilin signal peptidase PulO-like enzyme (type II secretory pathway)
VIILWALLGLLLGTFLNQLADNLPRRRRLMGSTCLQCGGPRPAWQRSAGVGALIGRSACGYCGAPRGRRAALVEALLVVAVPMVVARQDLRAGPVAGVLFLCLLLLIAVIDVEHRLILHNVSIPAAAAMATIGILHPAIGPAETLAGGAVAAAIVLLMYLGGQVFARWLERLRGEPLGEVPFGFGDVTLAAVIGLAVGWPAVVAALFLGVFAAGAYSLVYLVAAFLRRRYVAFQPIPYGPFLALGAFLVYFRVVSSVAGLLGR